MLKKLDVEFKYLLFIFLLITVVVVLGILSYKHDFSSDNSRKSAGAITQETTDGFQVGFSFSGDRAELIDLKKGIADFEVDYQGNANFTADILSSNGNLLYHLINVSGPYKGSKNLLISESGVYMLSVKTEGNWSITRK